MLVRKGYRYRIYPTDGQVARVYAWESALRFLWNLAHEQRRMGLARTDKRYPTAFDQINELTDLRAMLPWLADVPRNVCAELLAQLDIAWRRCFDRKARAPRWKRRGRDFLGLCEPHPKAWRIDGQSLRFPKLGSVPIKLHRPLEGKPKTCTLRRDGNHWYASILCEIEVATPALREAPVVGIDRGVTHLLGDSDGHLEPNPKHLERALRTLGRRQRALDHRRRNTTQKGSHNLEKAVARVRATHATVRRQRDQLLHTLSSRYAKSHGTVVLESLQIANMVQNPHLARHIAGAGWGRFAELLRYKLDWSGGQLAEVAPAYSSQTCSVCGVCDAASRFGARFSCASCGHLDHADVNAAKVLKLRYLAQPRVKRSGQPAEVTLPERARRSRKRNDISP